MFIYSSASQLWSAPRYFFTNTYTDKELVDILSSDNVIQYAVTKAKYESISSQLCKALGYATKGASTLVTDMVAKDNRQFAKGTYSDDDGYSLVADSVDKLREQLKKQYYESIGLKYYGSIGTPQERLQNVFSKYFKYQEDFVSNYNYLSDCKYFFYYSNDQYGWALTLNNSDNISYFYMGQGNYNMPLFAVDNELNVVDYSFTAMYSPFDNGYQNEDYKWGNLSMYNTFSYFTIPFTYESSNGTASGSNAFRFSSYNNKPFYYFKSYEALYNYVHGSQNAYLSSKVEEKGEDIKISIDDMNTNISSKMDELIDSINNGKGSMSADELQKAIDKGLESLSGKMDDIKDNTQETNNKLDSLLTVMQSQNEILLNILGVTTDIYTVVSSKDDEQDKAYDINYVQAVFNTMFKGLKNAVLYGQNTIKQNVNQDTDDVNSLVTDLSSDKVNYRNGLFGKFPFSVPYQLFEWLQVLCVEPVAPSFTLSYDFLLKDFIDDENRDNFKLIIDLNDDKYKEWADLMRSGEKLAFTIYMAIATYNRFKNEV